MHHIPPPSTVLIAFHTFLRDQLLLILLFAAPALGAAQETTEALTRWATYLGGVGDDDVRSIAVDDFGHVYVAGRTTAGTLLGNDTSGRSGLTHQRTYGGGNSDAFLAKFAPQGSMLWCTYFGGPGDDEAVRVVLTAMNGAYLVGHTTSTDSIATDTLALQPDIGGGSDLFVARFTEYGLLVGATYLGGPEDERASGAALDALGRLLICGQSNGPNTFSAYTPIQPWSAGIDGLLVCLTSTDSLTSGTYFGGTGDDEFVYVAGGDSASFTVLGNTTGSTGLATAGAPFPQPLGGADAFIVRMDTNLTVLRASYFGGTADDRAMGLSITDSTFIICGETRSDSIHTDTTSHQPLRAGDADGFLAVLDTTFAVTAFTYFGGPAYDAITAIRSDMLGSIYAVGLTASDTAIASGSGMLGGPMDAFALRFDSLQSPTWSRYLGAMNEDEALAMDLVGHTGVIVGGRTASVSDLSVNGHQMVHGGGSWDGFTTRMNQIISTICTGICTATSTGYGGGSSTCNGVSPPLPYFDVCLGDSIQFIVYGGALGSSAHWMWYADVCGQPENYLTTGDTITLFPTESFTLFVRAEGPGHATGCKSLPIVVHTYPAPAVTLNDTVCAGMPITMEGIGAEQFLWGIGDSTAMGTSAVITAPPNSGSYAVNITATNGPSCSVQLTDTVIVRGLPDPLWSISPLSCHGSGDGMIQLDSTFVNTIAITWQHDGSSLPTVELLAEGTYIATLEDLFGCTTTDTLIVTQPVPLIDSVHVEDALCGAATGSAEVITSSISPGLNFSWSGDLGGGTSVDGLLPGMYTVTATDSAGCTRSVALSIIAIGSIHVFVAADTLWAEEGESSLHCSLTPADSTANIQWAPSTGLAEPNAASTACIVTDTTLYIITVSNVNGCTASDTVLVIPEFTPPPITDPPCGEAFLPDIFSPNGDGLNDGLCLLGGCYNSMALNIHDHWGRSLYSSTQVDGCWDGTLNGQQVPAGKYVYTLTAERTTGEVIERTGTVTIVR